MHQMGNRVPSQRKRAEDEEKNLGSIVSEAIEERKKQS
jgi:hypothetical protein